MNQKTGALAILALTNGFILAMVACAPAPPPGNSTADGNLTPKKGSSSGGASASGTSTPAPSGSTPTTENQGNDGGETDDEGEGEDPNEAAAIARFMACVAQNPAAKAMADRANACFETCQDEACETSCESRAAQDCQTDQAACTIVQQCEDQAFPETGEGEEGTGNED